MLYRFSYVVLPLPGFFFFSILSYLYIFFFFPVHNRPGASKLCIRAYRSPKYSDVEIYSLSLFLSHFMRVIQILCAVPNTALTLEKTVTCSNTEHTLYIITLFISRADSATGHTANGREQFTNVRPVFIKTLKIINFRLAILHAVFVQTVTIDFNSRRFITTIRTPSACTDKPILL